VNLTSFESPFRHVRSFLFADDGDVVNET
jgi:hypothetical protein